jgi:ABC-type Fe3+-hydroxamate transport system substrate-binding protein
MKPVLDRRSFLTSLTAATLSQRLSAAEVGLRVASLDWALAETMIALGQKPIAIVAAGDWDRFVVEPPLPSGVVDLGLQQEINFELLASLKPDLILTSPFLQDADPILDKIGATLKLSIFEKGTKPLAQPKELMRILGERLARAEAARNFLGKAEETFESHRSRIASLRPLPVLLVNFIDARHVRVYGGAGLYQNVLDRIGVVNAWTAETNYWGYSTVGIEKLATTKNLRLIAFEPIQPDARPTLERSPLWSRLPFVKAGQVSVLPSVLMFGAMPSALRFARLLVDHLETVSK